jgi:hypothetical protein
MSTKNTSQSVWKFASADQNALWSKAAALTLPRWEPPGRT